MSNKYCFLVTLADKNQLLKVAFTTTTEELNGVSVEYWNEPEAQEFLQKKLPTHILTAGSIVCVEPIFDII